MANRVSKIMNSDMIASRNKAKFDSVGVVKVIDGVLQDGNGNVISVGSGGSGGSSGSGGSLVYDTLAQLQSAFPNGSTQPAFIRGEGKWYYWSGTITDTTAPVLTITSGGNFTGTKTVTMTTDETATIYYTDDNTDPKVSATKKTYSSALNLSATKTIKAYAKDTTGNESAVQTITYTLVVSGDTTPPVLTITPSATFSTTQSVTMTTDETATIYYTDDNTDPKSSGTKKTYSSALSLSATTTIKAYAVDTAGNESVVQSVTYTKQVADTTPPVITPSVLGGNYTSNQTVALSSNETATIYYTVDGTNPTYPVSGTTQTYSSPIILSNNTTLKYIGRDSAGNVSAVQTQTYNIDTTVYTVRDTFTRTDSTTMGVADTGQSWTAVAGTWGTNGSQAYLTVNAADAGALIDTGKSDQNVTVTLADKTNARVLFRGVDLGNYLLVHCQATYELRKRVGGTFTTIQTASQVPANGDVVNIVTSGSSITVKVNGVTIITATETQWQTSTKVGLGTYNTGTTARFDDLKVV